MGEGMVDLQKLPRREDGDVDTIDTDLIDLQDLQAIGQSSPKPEKNILSSLIDGFLVQTSDVSKKPKKPKKNRNKAKISIRVKGPEDEKKQEEKKPEEDEEVEFPVKEIISGIYNLVASWTGTTTTPKPSRYRLLRIEMGLLSES